MMGGAFTPALSFSLIQQARQPLSACFILVAFTLVRLSFEIGGTQDSRFVK